MQTAQVIQASTPYASRFPLVLADATTDVAGILWHYEPGHPLSGWGGGIPQSGTILRNIVRQEAAVTIGTTPDRTDTAVHHTGLTGATGILERTAKGGIHAAIAPTALSTTGSAGLDGGPGVQIPLPTDIRAHMLANRGHAYAVALLMMPTRDPAAGKHNFNIGLFSAGPDVWFIDAGTNGNFCAHDLRNPAYAPWGTVGQPVNRYMSVASEPTSVTGTVYAHAWAFGNVTPVNRGNPGAGGGQIFYASIGIDLTIAGLTTAAWKAKIDGALAARAVAGDTYTSPASL